MRVISVDDEELTVQYMEKVMRQVEPGVEFLGFTDADSAFTFLSKNTMDIALLDIELGEYNGITLAKKCKELCPQINIIFVTGYSQYAMDALRIHASGYLMKPVRAEELRVELENLRHPLQTSTANRVRIQTFGSFEIFVDEQPLKLPLAKCRECLAYLVDRKGSRVSTAELAGVLWEDKPLDKTLRNSVHQVVSTLMKALKEVGCDNIIIKHSRQIAMDPSKVDCDYFRVLQGDVAQLNLFNGEYMSNYSWAEFTVGEMVNKINTI